MRVLSSRNLSALRVVVAVVLGLALLGCPSDDEPAPGTQPVADQGPPPAEDLGAEPADPGPAADPGTEVPDEGPLLPDLPPYEYEGPMGPETLFSHGVASGDPTSEGVVLWTRVSPEAGAGKVEVFWELSLDTAFAERIQVGTVETSADRDFTVKVEVESLKAGTTYYYRFHSLGRQSVVGRTRTTPSGDTARLRIAVVCGSNVTRGYFHVFRRLAERSELDLVVHLGDYFYEYGAMGFVPSRDHQPLHEAKDLTDYRIRYGQYRLDADLQEVHRQHPFVTVWDDHESANNSWKGGAENHDEGEGSWADRKAASMKAWFEWMPARETADGRIFQTLKLGGLADLIVLDTRLFGRDEQANPNDQETIDDPNRTILGFEQEEWAFAELKGSKAKWRLLASQVMLAPLLAGGALLNNDQWDGYPASRDRLVSVIEDEAMKNVVVLSGDIHSSWANEIPGEGDYNPDTGDGSVAVEFVTPAVTSGFPLDPVVSDFAVQMNPHIKYSEVLHNGYYLLDVTESRVQAAWFFTEDVKAQVTSEFFGAAYSVAAGTTWLQQDDAPAEAPAATTEPAP